MTFSLSLTLDAASFRTIFCVCAVHRLPSCRTRASEGEWFSTPTASPTCAYRSAVRTDTLFARASMQDICEYGRRRGRGQFAAVEALPAAPRLAPSFLYLSLLAVGSKWRRKSLEGRRRWPHRQGTISRFAKLPEHHPHRGHFPFAREYTVGNEDTHHQCSSY